MLVVSLTCMLLCTNLMTAADTTTVANSGRVRTLLGARAGFGGTFMDFESPRMGFEGSVFYYISLVAVINSGAPGTFGFQPEMQYVRESMYMREHGTGPYYNDRVEHTIAFESLRFPLLAKLSLGSPGSIQPSILIGPYINALLAGSATAELGTQSEAVEIVNLNKINVGAIIGVDVRVPPKLVVDARVSIGLTNYPRDLETIDRLHSISLGLGLLF